MKNLLLNLKKLPEAVWPLLITIKDMALKRSYLWVILLFAFLTRMYSLGDVGASKQELENIERIFSMPGSFLGKGTSTNLYYLLQNLWGRAFGFSVLNLRIFSVLLSILGLYIFFKFTEEWFNRKLAYISTFLLSISSFHILLSRNISHEVLYPVIIISALHFLTLAYRNKKLIYFVLAGMLLGLSLYTSEISLVLVLVFFITGIYFYSKNRKFFFSFIREKTIVIFSGVTVALPFFYSLFVNPGNFLSNFTYKPDIIFDNARSLVLSVIYTAPQEFMYNIGTDKVFDPFIEITFILGLIYIAMRVKRRKFYFLVTWLSLLTVIIIFKNIFSLGSFIYTAPIIFIMSARIQIYVLDKWFKTFPFNKFARIVMVLGIGFLFSLSLSYNYKKIFQAWIKFPERKFVYNVQPTTYNLKDEKAYIYKAGYSKDTVATATKVKKGNLSELDKLNDIKGNKKANIFTSPESVFKVKSSLSDVRWKEYKGENIVLLKGE